MSDISQIQESSPPLPDKGSQREAKYLLAKQSRKNRMEGTTHWITIVLLYIIVVIILGVGVCRFIHLILPPCRQWLTKEQLSDIDEFFVHGTFGALIVAFLRDKISKKE